MPAYAQQSFGSGSDESKSILVEYGGKFSSIAEVSSAKSTCCLGIPVNGELRPTWLEAPFILRAARGLSYQKDSRSNTSTCHDR